MQVTTLGYGAMELRGAPRARDITEAQEENILNAVLDAGINYIDTSIERAEQGTDRPLYRASALPNIISPANAAALSGRRRRHAASVAHMFHARQHHRWCRAEPHAHQNRLPGRRPNISRPPANPRRAGRTTRQRRSAWPTTAIAVSPPISGLTISAVGCSRRTRIGPGPGESTAEPSLRALLRRLQAERHRPRVLARGNARELYAG